MIVAGKVLSHPQLYRMAADSMETSLKVLAPLCALQSLKRMGAT